MHTGPGGSSVAIRLRAWWERGFMFNVFNVEKEFYA